ncbi:hypothetical protein HDZ31DRAFT_34811 [Schizophyllum fasciatum]
MGRPVASIDGEIIVFRSSDNVLFNMHRANLRAVTDGPFAEDFASTDADVADLTEDSAPLDVLFQFVYPGKLPCLEDTEFQSLCTIAEAAEKYRVAPAMVVCYIRMKFLLSSHPLAVKAYAYKHGYADLIDPASPSSLGEPAKEAFQAMGPGPLHMGWSMYRDAHLEVLITGTYHIQSRSHSDDFCDNWGAVVHELDMHLGKGYLSRICSIRSWNPSWALNLGYLLADQRYCFAQSRQERKAAFITQVEAIPPLSNFIRRAEGRAHE